jgi:hypothetical protein
MSKVYCGTERLPKGKKMGSMSECVKAGQVRRFGLFAVDPMLLAAKIDTGPSAKDYRTKMIGLKGKLAAVGNRYKRANDPVTKKLAAEEYQKIYAETKAAMDAYERVQKGDNLGRKKQELTLNPRKVNPKKRKNTSKVASKASKGRKAPAKKAASKKTTTKKATTTKRGSKKLSRTKANSKRNSKAKNKRTSKKNSKRRVNKRRASRK